MTQKRTTRPGEKLVYGFAATGLTLAVAIGAWTWNSSIPEPKNTTSQASSAAQVADAAATGATSSVEPATAKPEGTPTRNPGKRGSSPRTQPSESLNRPPQEHHLALAPLGEDDPYLPPDTWRGNGGPEPSETVMEQAPEKATPPRQQPQPPKLPDNLPVRPKAPWNEWLEEWVPKRPNGKPGGNKESKTSTPKPAPPAKPDDSTLVPGDLLGGEITDPEKEPEPDPEPETESEPKEKDTPRDPSPREASPEP